MGDKTTKVSCENKTGVEIEVMLYVHKGEEKKLSVKAGKSNKIEWTSNEFLRGTTVGIKTIGTKEFQGTNQIGIAFDRSLEGKYATGPRTVNIVVTNDKITTVITNSEEKRPETIVNDIKSPLN